MLGFLAPSFISFSFNAISFLLQEKLCHEIAGDLEEEVMAQKIQDELDQVERRVYVLEKEENELRRVRLYFSCFFFLSITG